MGEIHVRHAFIEIVRHVLSAGASIAYGGDLRRSGYTHAMFDLVRTYKVSERLGPERVRNYLAWPIFDGLSTSERAAAKRIATLVRVDAPEGAPTTLPSTESGDPTDRAWAAKALTEMRAALAKEVSAQVVLGGKTSGQTGVVPGIAEEVALAIRAGNPLYPIGGFGGCATLVADVFREGKSPQLTLDYQLEVGTDEFRSMVEVMGYDSSRARLREVVTTLSSAGWPNLANGLSADENERLLESDDVEEIVILLLRGLRSL